MYDPASPHVNGISTIVAGMLVALGILVYADVGGPLVIAGGLVVAAALRAVRLHRRADRG
jgi:hypothetical protein